jgi:hypothetical protein
MTYHKSMEISAHAIPRKRVPSFISAPSKNSKTIAQNAMKIASMRGGVEQNAITLAINVLERGISALFGKASAGELSR